MASKQKLRVMAVDDETFMLDLYRDSLKGSVKNFPAFDIEYDACLSGEAAVTAVEQSIKAQRPYALIFLDINLGAGMDGITAGEQIRDLDREVNLVIATGDAGANPLDIGNRIPPWTSCFTCTSPSRSWRFYNLLPPWGANGNPSGY